MTSMGESRTAMPHCFNLSEFSFLNKKSQLSTLKSGPKISAIFFVVVGYAEGNFSVRIRVIIVRIYSTQYFHTLVIKV